MVRREIEIDDETDRILTVLARQYEGDLSKALTDLVHVREGLEAFAAESELANESTLRLLRDKAEADFREGRTRTWDEIKASSPW